mmetsp:Transcript_47852/g.112977  ORF Transcript_47852/g.112977 Transcript_47852/m.112977 type:complete len:265 (+) Transcript_47852:29-823(+)
MVADMVAHAQRILLTSDGVSSPLLREKLDALLRETDERRIWYIPTSFLDGSSLLGSEGQPRTQELVAKMHQIAKVFRLDDVGNTLQEIDGSAVLKNERYGTIGFVDPVLGGDAAQLAVSALKPNAVYLDRGNTFALQHYLRESGCGALVKQCAQAGALVVGASAGSVVLGKSVSTTFWKGRKDPTLGGRIAAEYWTEDAANGLDLLRGSSVFVHANAHHPEHGNAEWQRQKAAAHGPALDTVLLLADGEGVLMRGEEKQFFPVQ